MEVEEIFLVVDLAVTGNGSNDIFYSAVCMYDEQRSIGTPASNYSPEEQERTIWV